MQTNEIQCIGEMQKIKGYNTKNRNNRTHCEKNTPRKINAFAKVKNTKRFKYICGQEDGGQ